MPLHCRAVTRVPFSGARDREMFISRADGENRGKAGEREDGAVYGAAILMADDTMTFSPDWPMR